MTRRRTSSKKKRTLTPEQLEKMKAGRERAKKEREAAAKQKERVEMLSELDERLAKGRREYDEGNKVKISKRRKHRY